MVGNLNPNGCCICLNGVRQAVKPIDLVEIYAENDVRFRNETGQYALTVLFENSALGNVTHPLQKIWITIRSDAAGGMAQLFEIGTPCQCGSNGVSIWIGVT